MIIVEGMDNTGKSTLVQVLAEEFNLCKVGTYRKPQSLEMIHDYDNWLEHSPQPIILDRHPAISDLIYGKILRNKSYITESETKSWSKRHLIVYCRPTTDSITRSWNDRKQMPGVKDNILRLTISYDFLMEEIDHVPYDHTNLNGVKDAVRNYLQCSN